ncbi:MAG: DEAD/DEAH box helicase, partial [Micromonosporaceae bacterium]|nr:DEAD/DEAH box helicase [Micromonosporaceae bacterium]
MRVRGIVAGEVAHVIAVMPMGPDAVTVVYGRASKATPEVRMLMRANEPQLVEIEEQPVPFDADPAEFLLAAQALWIRKEARPTIADGPCQPLPHQLDAVYRHMLPQIPLRFLLADDPGAGKTIMAGLYLRELTLRSDVQRCLIVAPGSLVEQWRQEMHEKFSLEFTLLDQALIDQIRLNRFVLERPLRLIARMDQLARHDELVAAFARTTWDVVVVDEAHRMSAHYGAGGEVKATKRYRLGMALREVAHHFLLMTATPHAGKEEDFQLFMRLVDPDRFEGRYRPGVHATGADGLWLRRTKEELVTLEGRPLFPKRAAYTVKYELSPEEASLYEAVRAYVRDEFDRADSLDDRQQRANVGFAMTVLQRRLASSPRAIEESLRRRLERLKETLAGAGSAKARARPPKVEIGVVAQEYAAAEREEYEELVVTGASASRTPDELRREIAVLEQLLVQAERVRQSRTDRKWHELRNLLEKNTTIVDPDGNVRKIIIFTEHRDTLDYLVERCRELLGPRGVVASIHGGHSHEQRRATQRRFTTEPQCRILIATDAAGEGLNLQVAHLMVNYDLPWNPNRLEQRFGRIHRIGQTEMCHLWNLVASQTREGAVYTRLLEKLEVMREALQGKVFDILGEVFEETPLHELLLKAVRQGDDPEVRRYLETVIDERIAEVTRRLVEQHALTPEVYRSAAHTEYRRQVQVARARRLQPNYIRQFFQEAFERVGGRLVKREPGRWEIPQVPPRVRDFSRGAVREVRVPRVCFDPAYRQLDGSPDAELLAPGEHLFEAVRGYIEHTYGAALTRGTVLIDPA